MDLAYQAKMNLHTSLLPYKAITQPTTSHSNDFLCFFFHSSLSQHTETVDFSFNQLADPRFTFHDHALVEAVKLENLEVHAFFRLLALCHTVMAEEKKEGEEG